jgi:hypothetical protein
MRSPGAIPQRLLVCAIGVEALEPLVARLAADPKAPAQLRDAELASLMRVDEVLPLVHSFELPEHREIQDGCDRI